MTRPDTCGEAGGAVSLWVRVLDCSESICGIVTTRSQFDSAGFAVSSSYSRTV